MFGRKGRVELNRRHLIAVRLIDAINLSAPSVIPGFKPILGGFLFRYEEEEHWPGSLYNVRIYLEEPSGWPSGSVISCVLIPKDGWFDLDKGEIVIAGQGKYNFSGLERGGGCDYKPLASGLLEVSIYREEETR